MDDCFENVDGKTKFMCVSISSVVALITFLIAFSFGAVEPTEYGIMYNRLTKNLDTSTIHEGGLQFIGFASTMITFPRTHKVVEFSDFKGAQQIPLSTRTKEGLELKLHVSFQYKLVKEQLPQLYSLAGQDYEALYTKIAANVILQKAGDYLAPQYWKERY